MKIAYLITAYNNPNHLQRLVRSLSSDSSAFFIHIDRKSNLSDFSNLNEDNVYFSKERISSYWGDFSTIKAVLSLIRMVLDHQSHFDYFTLLSGTDYPLQPVSYIEDFFEQNRGKEFINIVQMPCEEAGKPITRLTTYKPASGGPCGPQIANVIRKLLKISGRYLPVNRDYKSQLQGLVPYGGSTWWALSREACEYIHGFVEANPKVVEFFKHTYIPEESFFQTILGNSPYKTRINRNLTYADWTGGGSSPANITESRLELLTANPAIMVDDEYGKGEVLFARKFTDEAEEIVLRLDQLIREKRSTS